MTFLLAPLTAGRAISQLEIWYQVATYAPRHSKKNYEGKFYEFQKFTITWCPSALNSQSVRRNDGAIIDLFYPLLYSEQQKCTPSTPNT